MSKGERAVVVTTEHRGVFFGYARETSGETIALRAARLCVYWSADLRGFMGLASHGPNSSCKVGPAADIAKRERCTRLSIRANGRASDCGLSRCSVKCSGVMTSSGRSKGKLSVRF